ncbi:hypothetical protein [Streptomyces exfoliatus]|nr:hypothetical protein [Streptomyces exfoliatus]
MWNGHVDAQGPAGSPHVVRIRLQDGESATMSLRLEGFDGSLSSWAGLLRAYERWALLDEGQIIEQFCERLMQALPKGLAQVPAAPSPLFTHFVEQVAPRQLALIDELAAEYGDPDDRGRGGYGDHDAEWLAPLRHFWEVTYPGALEMRFPEAARATRPNLRTLYERHGPRGGRPQARGQGRRQGQGQGLRPVPEQAGQRSPRSGYGDGDGYGYGDRYVYENGPGPRTTYENGTGPGAGDRPDPRTAYGHPAPAPAPAAEARPPRSSVYEGDWELEPEPEPDWGPDFGPDHGAPRGEAE